MKNFYIPRAKMPQIDEQDLPHLIATAFDKKLTPQLEVVDPNVLHAHQRVNHDRAFSMPIQFALKPVLISQDNFILDGNHRWWKHIHSGDKAMNVIRLGLKFDEAITWLFTLPFTYHIDRSTPVRN